MKSFFIKFNVMWLGSLFFLVLSLAGIQQSARFSASESLMWSTTCLDGIVVGAVMMGLLLLALLSWCYALWKSCSPLRCKGCVRSEFRSVLGQWLLGRTLQDLSVLG